MELIRLYVTRIFAHWSSDESHLSRFMNEIISYQLSPRDSLEQPFDTPPRASSRSELVSMIFDELCGRPDMIGFIKHVSEGVGPNGKVLLVNGAGETSSLCSQIVEPICQRLDSLSTSGRIPVALRCMISSIIGQTRENDSRRGGLLFLFVNSFIPRITRWLAHSNTQPLHSLTDDCSVSIGEQTQLLEAVQDLLKLCFTKGVSDPGVRSPQPPALGSVDSHLSSPSRALGGKFSLQTHAILSRSKWLISRSDFPLLPFSYPPPLCRFIEECSLPSIPSSNNQNPVRQMANFVGLKPFQCVNCISLSGRDLWKTLLQLDKVAEGSVSVWTTEIRGLLADLSHLVHDPDYQEFWRENKRSYLLQWQQKKRIGEVGGRYSSKLSDLHGKERDGEREGEVDYDHPGARELVSINWIINATKNVLRSLYAIQSEEIPHDITLYQELLSLKESLESRKGFIDLCLRDLHSLHTFEELNGVYRSELLLLIEMVTGDSEAQDLSGGSHKRTTIRPFTSRDQQRRTEEEYLFSLSRLCHRQFEIETKISNRQTPTQAHAGATFGGGSASRSAEKESPMKGRSPSKRRLGGGASNSLHMLLQNVFPVENLAQRRGTN
jgi:hypothetical protein